MTEQRGVIVMAYGTPQSLDGVAAYYTDIRRGRPPPPELLEELTDRYRAIGGRSPLLEITQEQALGVEERIHVKTYLGQKHAAPSIPDAVRRLRDDGVERAVGLVLAPHYSRMSIGDYESRVRVAADEQGWAGKLEMIDSWHLEPGYIGYLATEVERALNDIPVPARESSLVVFSAHSLPEKILASGDPYADQLRETAQAVAERAGIERWQIGWQSAGRTQDPWLGPDILQILADVAATGETAGVVVCPCGFVADHLEVLYDIDIEAQALAQELGLELRRTRAPNDDPAFLDCLAAVVDRAFQS
ncbi:MAG: protoporphyrin/coproporphyrin ferrochelatase [Actinomycetota bacterium]|nr:protoporphyrin/coproporphyrin ferrochelatase [Actinomycetota bacterium]